MEFSTNGWECRRYLALFRILSNLQAVSDLILKSLFADHMGMLFVYNTQARLPGIPEMPLNRAAEQVCCVGADPRRPPLNSVHQEATSIHWSML